MNLKSLIFLGLSESILFTVHASRDKWYAD